MLQTFQKLRHLLTVRERHNTLLVFAMMVILGLLEAGGVATIMPFLAVLLKPELVRSSDYLAALYSRLEFADINGFLFFLALMFFIIVVGRITFAALTQYATLRYSAALGYTLSTRLLEIYLRQPYVWFLREHSANLGKNVL